MEERQPFIRIVKRDSLKKRYVALLYVGAIVFALLIGAILLLALDVKPLAFYRDMVTIGTIGNRFPENSYDGLIRLLVPLLITSLGLALAFKMRFWNIGGEGQFIIGAIVAAAVAFTMGDSLSRPVLLLLMALCGGVSAGLYGFSTAVLKVKFGTNETLLTLMLNYIALYLLKFFGETKADWNVFLDTTTPRPFFARLPESAWMPTIPLGKFSLNISLLVAVGLVVVLFVYLSQSKQGYEISVVGDSIQTARYAGMPVNKIIMRTVFLSAFLIGVAGSFHVSTARSLSVSITNDVGWTGIVVAWLSKLNPIGILITSVLISVLQYGCQVASLSYSSIDSHFAEMIQGIILFVVLAIDFFVRFRIVIGHKKEHKA